MSHLIVQVLTRIRCPFCFYRCEYRAGEQVPTVCPACEVDL